VDWLLPRDPLSIVEAGYDLSVSDGDWTAQITQGVSLALTGPAGTVGYRFNRRPGFRYKAASIAVARGYSELGVLTAGVLRRFPTDDLERFFDRGGVTSVSESCKNALPRSSTERGLVDFCGIVVGNSMAGFVVGAPLESPAIISKGARRCWRGVAAHLSAAFRLRSALVEPNALVPEAVLSPEGRVLHATGGATARSSRDVLRAAAMGMERARRAMRRDPSEALRLWRELVAGRWTLVDHFDADGRHFLFAHVNPEAAASLRELSPRQVSVLRLVREGLAGKRVAGLLGISEGAVSQNLHQAMRKLRLRSLGSLLRVSRLLEQPRSPSWIVKGEVGAFDLGACHAPSRIPELSAAERQISELLLDGASNSEIAEIRGSVYRTVANQIARIYEKLGVNSRAELALLMAPPASERAG